MCNFLSCRNKLLSNKMRNNYRDRKQICRPTLKMF